MIPVLRLSALLLAAITFGIAGTAAQAADTPAGEIVTLPSGLRLVDTKVGDGPSPRPGSICVMHYTGWLYENGAKGAKFDSSLDRGAPFSFPLGQHQVIKGWDEGRRQANAHHPAGTRLWQPRRRRRHPARCDPDLRRRTAGGEERLDGR